MAVSIGNPALGVSLAVAAFAAAMTASAQEASEKVEASVLIAGEPSGSYSEETVARGGRIEDTVEQHFVFNRLGSRIELSEKDVYEEDAAGRILSGHSETSSSKSTVTMDYAVRGDRLVLTTHSGGRDYSSEASLRGPLFGPAGMRRMLMHASAALPDLRYQTFASSLGGAVETRFKYLGVETIDGAPARKFTQTLQGMPGASTVWADPKGYTVRMTMDSPFGPIQIVRGAAGVAANPQSPTESYESTLAISNIKLPHPRVLESVTVELTKKPGADSHWPDFASANQAVLKQSADVVVLKITQPRAGGKSSAPPRAIDTAPNALIQSDDPAVGALAKTIAGRETDPWKKVLRLQAWVAANMHFDAGIAVAPANELVRDRHGTCMGYAILLASLARAQGIPTHIRMGYVYDGGIWGGHAWTEMFVRGQWLPIDSAEYRPGVADAAHLGVITVEGENGGIEHIGDLALLFGKIEVRALGYGLDGRAVSIARSDADHVVQDDAYNNPWLGFAVHKPAAFSYADLDAHWPRHDVLTMKSPGGEVHIAYLQAADEPLDQQMSDALAIVGPARPALWNGAHAVRIDGAGKSAIAGVSGDVVWAVIAEGPDPAGLLDKVLPGVAIADLTARGRPGGV